MTPFERTARAHANSRSAEGTQKLYNADLDRWLAFCAATGIDPANPEEETAMAYKVALETTDKAQTVRRKLAALSSIYNAVMGNRTALAVWNPFKNLPRPKADDFARTEALSKADAEAIIEVAACDPNADTHNEGTRDYAILVLLYDTGLRRTSIATLEQSDVIKRQVRNEDGSIGIQTVLRVIVKGGKRGEVELPARAADVLSLWMDFVKGEKYVFPGRNGKPLHKTIINRIVKERAEQAGIKGVHPHQFRATFATDAIDSGKPLHEVQAAMHHATPAMTQRYDRGERGRGVTSALAKFREGKK